MLVTPFASLLAAQAQTQTSVSRDLSSLRQLGITELENKTHHVQGIVVDGDTLWVTSVSKPDHAGYLHEFELASGRHRATVEIHQGDQYHPGGLDHDRDSLWVPIAEYSRLSTAQILRIDKKTRKVNNSFQVPDHIGCVATASDRIYGGNWDSKDIYEWKYDGTLIRKRPNPGRTGYQDLKFVDGMLVGGGGLSKDEGAIDWLDAETLQLRKQILTGKTDRGLRYTNEGMAIAHGTLYLLPEDGPSRLFAFAL